MFNFVITYSLNDPKRNDKTINLQAKKISMTRIYNILFALLLLGISTQVSAQIEGDNIFADDQVIRIDLEFSQAGFFDSLTANYETSTYMKADLTLTDNTGAYTFEDVGVRLKGNSTYNHPNNKKSFKIDFNKYVSGQNYDGLKKLNFSNGFKDPTFLREKVFFDVSKAAGVPAPRANFANVYFNGTLWGFYTVVEQIDDQFLDWRIGDDDGNLFKAGSNFGAGPGGGGTPADLVYYGDNQSAYEERYELKSNEDENDWTDLIEFIDFINNSSDADFEAGLGDRLELGEYLTSAALDNMFGNFDSYTGSARNWYIYHNLTTDKWEWVKWDGNESFGSYPAGGGGGPGGGGGNNPLTLAIDYSDNDRPLLENIFDSPTLYTQYQNKMCVVLENYFNSEYLDPKIDALKDLIQESVFADNNKQYSNADFTTNIESNLSGGGPGPGGGTTYGLKSFVTERSAYLTGVLDCSSVSTQETVYEQIKVHPNPVSDFLILGEVNSEILIYDARAVLVSKISNYTGQLDVSQLSGGMYFLTFEQNEGQRVSATFVKM